MKKYFKEFKEFAVKGNVVDLAVAVIIGGAFGKIVSSLVADIVMPLVSFIAGGLDFKNWKFVLREVMLGDGGEIIKPAVILNTGNFVQNIFDFLVIALSVFMMIKIIGRVKNKLAEEFLAKKEAEKELGEKNISKDDVTLEKGVDSKDGVKGDAPVPEKKPELLTKDQEILVEIRDLLKEKSKS